MRLRAIIFDLDGTLLDTLEDLADAMNSVLAEARLPTHPVSAYRTFVGDGIEMLVRRSLPFEVPDEREFARFVELARRAYAERWSCKTQPYPGVPEMVRAFAAAGLRVSVLSNKPDDAVHAVVRTFLPEIGFEVVLGATPSRPRKPDPAAALEIAGRLGVAPAQIAFMGDSSVDMRTAVAAGMFPIGVLWGFRTAEELIASGARLLVAAPGDLLPMLSAR
jgi:phosphoglycolate phosphatase